MTREELRERVAQLFCGGNNPCDACFKDAADRIEQLEAALRFYAGWPQGSAGNIAPFLMDAGRIARAALEGK